MHPRRRLGVTRHHVTRVTLLALVLLSVQTGPIIGAATTGISAAEAAPTAATAIAAPRVRRAPAPISTPVARLLSLASAVRGSVSGASYPTK